MRANTFILLIAMAGAGVYPSTALPQRATKPDYPPEQVAEANQLLDVFIQQLNAQHDLPFTLNAEQRFALVKKYLGESNRSPYFWQHLLITVSESPKYWALAKSTQSDTRRANEMMAYGLATIMGESWGVIVLKSEPNGADVFLKIYSGRSKEGNTEIKRKYPEGGYQFIIEKKGYKSKEINVSIQKEKPVEEKVTLERE